MKSKSICRTVLLALLMTLSASAFAQIDPATAAKRAARRNMTVKEWNTDAKSKTRWLDRVTTYDSDGRKIEETEYTQYGQKWRETFEYGPNDKIVKEVHYNEKNKPERISKYEYDSAGRKTRQCNYSPNGKLLTTKVFEYVM